MDHEVFWVHVALGLGEVPMVGGGSDEKYLQKGHGAL